MAKIILKSQFTVSSKQSLFNFVDYVTRNQALKDKKKEQSLSDTEEKELERMTQLLSDSEFSVDDVYSDYIDYMKREQATLSEDDHYLKGVFSSSQTKVRREDVRELKQEIEDVTRQSRMGSVMFQDVISFENDFLIEENILNPKTNALDQDRLYKATEKMMGSLKENEKLHDTFWFASIHRNTDNIHLHICSMEKNNTRELKEVADGQFEVRGKRKQRTLDKMKLAFGQELTSPTYRLQLQTSMTNNRDSLLKDLKKTYETEVFSDNRSFLTEINTLKKELPDNKFNWQYGKLKPDTQKRVDRLTDVLTQKSPERMRYTKNVDAYATYLKELYGESAKPDEYLANKEQEIKTRLGNNLLNNLKKDHAVINHKVKKMLDDLPVHPKEGRDKKEIQKKETPKIEARPKASPYHSRKNMAIIKKNLVHDYDMKRAENDYEQTQYRIAAAQQRQSYDYHH